VVHFERGRGQLLRGNVATKEQQERTSPLLPGLSFLLRPSRTLRVSDLLSRRGGHLPPFPDTNSGTLATLAPRKRVLAALSLETAAPLTELRKRPSNAVDFLLKFLNPSRRADSCEALEFILSLCHRVRSFP
jgi:hypothetical protein